MRGRPPLITNRRSASLERVPEMKLRDPKPPSGSAVPFLLYLRSFNDAEKRLFFAWGSKEGFRDASGMKSGEGKPSFYLSS